MGGTRDEAVLQLPDDEILSIVREELRQILGLNAEPLFTRIYRWKGAMAQYVVGHLERLERIEVLLKQWPGLVLAGNAYRGIGVPDCVRSGEAAAQQVLASASKRQTSERRYHRRHLFRDVTPVTAVTSLLLQKLPVSFRVNTIG